MGMNIFNHQPELLADVGLPHTSLALISAYTLLLKPAKLTSSIQYCKSLYDPLLIPKAHHTVLKGLQSFVMILFSIKLINNMQSYLKQLVHVYWKTSLKSNAFHYYMFSSGCIAELFPSENGKMLHNDNFLWTFPCQMTLRCQIFS